MTCNGLRSRHARRGLNYLEAGAWHTDDGTTGADAASGFVRERISDEFTIADVRDASLGASDSLIGKVLARLRDEGLIEAGHRALRQVATASDELTTAIGGRSGQPDRFAEP